MADDGAGSAGAVLASRLSKDPDLSLLLLEAGGAGTGRWIDIPIGYFKTDPKLLDWTIAWPRGRGLGGISLINGMLYLRGHKRDYDHWHALGNEGWDWTSGQPYFERSLLNARPGGGQQGAGLWVTGIPRDDLSEAFIAPAQACGIPKKEDFNDGDNAGAAYVKMTTRNGRRISSARGFLYPVRERTNLHVKMGCHARRIVTEKGRALGVKAIASDESLLYRARHQVVLSCGAVQSPLLLQFCGIGDPDQLRALLIDVVSPLPGVGKNLQDHLQFRPTYRLRGIETLNEIANSRVRSLREYLHYLLTGGGVLNSGVFRASAFFSAERDSD